MLCGSKWRLSNNSVVEVSWEGGEEVMLRPRAWEASMWTWPPVPPPSSATFLSRPQIASLRFVFLINQDLIALIRAEAAKITPQ